MIKLGLTRNQYRELDDLLNSAHSIKIKVVLMDLDHNHKEDLSDAFYDGLVSVDAEADITRALDLVLFDPMGRINLDPNSPHRTSVFMADMIGVKYVVSDPLGTKRFIIPVFCGPIDDVSRDDWKLNIKCLGKDSLGSTPVWQGRMYKEGQLRTDVIEDILVDIMGETKLNLISHPAKLNGDLKIDRTENPVTEAKKLARSMGLHLFWDGTGTAILRRRKASPVRPHLTERWLTTRPRIEYDLSKTINAVRVTGKKRKGKPAIKVKAVAKRRHPLSPWRVGRLTAPRFLWLEINDDSIESVAEARKVAREQLRQGLLAGVEVTADCIPHPRWEELDVVKFKLTEFNTKAYLKRYTIPLVAGDESTIGYLKRVRPQGGQRHKSRHGHKDKGKP